MKLSRNDLKELIKEIIVTEAQTTQQDEEPEPAPQLNKRLGQKQVTRQQLASAEHEKAKDIRGGSALANVEPIENAILLDVEKVLTAIAEEDDLNKYRNILQNVVNVLRKKAGV